MSVHPLAQSLNDTLRNGNSIAYTLLSDRGRGIYFPSKGILGQSAEARGKEINATIGTALEDDGSPLTLGCLEEMVEAPKSAFLYAPSFGNPELRAKWKQMLVQKNPSLVEKAFSTPVVSAALTHALSVSGYLFANPGDEIILPDLYWDNYELLFQQGYGASFKLHNTFKEHGYDIDALAAVLTDGGIGKKIVLLNFPNNPTGYTLTDAEAQSIVTTLIAAADAGNKLLVLLDDAYFGLVYKDGITRQSLFSALCNAHENILAVKMDGPTKEDYVWGFRVGFMTFGFKGATEEQYKALEAKAAGTVRGTLSNVPNISQSLLLAAYNKDVYASQKADKFNTLKTRYEKIVDILNTHSEYEESFVAMPFNSGYFMCVRLKGADPEKVRTLLLEKYSTGVIVLAGLIRLAFSAVPYDKLDALFQNLHSAVQEVVAK
ncbi:MAG: aminotransferase class I/II-fold pyridoxal phosphate-dependent enzyme [Deltaproteobacteria bacterium]|nr:aminotransferase class I/II-fold pyridoxal phosphate-dependent enzyme [Deltaproteobacteria bacterium]MBN2673991.1 aminotransferase class I/II-fold pyridoxal phosphate-dependent enzyme [Deltaproteobacteria bacterium]